jgi:hypothetical protein
MGIFVGVACIFVVWIFSKLEDYKKDNNNKGYLGLISVIVGIVFLVNIIANAIYG